MKINLNPKLISFFEENMAQYPDWMHTYSFGKNIYTGYYKYQGIIGTFVNSSSPKNNIDIFRNSYNAIDFSHVTKFRQKLFNLKNITNMTCLDISAATGQFSIAACQAGFRRVIASEIRISQI